jgi:hypothetical protein
LLLGYFGGPVSLILMPNGQTVTDLESKGGNVAAQPPHRPRQSGKTSGKMAEKFLGVDA